MKLAQTLLLVAAFGAVALAVTAPAVAPIVSICERGAAAATSFARYSPPNSDFDILATPELIKGCKNIHVPANTIPLLVVANTEAAIVSVLGVQANRHHLDATTAIIMVPADRFMEIDHQLGSLEKAVLYLASPSKGKRTPERLVLSHGKNASKAEILNSIDNASYEDILGQISGAKPLQLNGRDYNIATRYTGTDDNVLTAEFMLNYFQSLGYEAFFESFRSGSTTTQNIIGVKRGTTLASEIVVMGAHMDSTSNSPTTSAPGAIDNGSGTVGVMLAARAFANVTTSRTIHFVLFGAEEQGLVGSAYYVKNLDSNGYNVVSALVMDMIGYSEKHFGVKIEGTPDTPTREIMDLMGDNLDEFSPELTYYKAYYSFGSDHVSFQNAGIPSFLSIEEDDVDYPGYHRTTDTISYLNTNQATDITIALTGCLYDLTVSA